MPTYEFYNTKTDEMEEHRMSYKDLDKFAEDNPHLEKRISSPNIVSKVGSRTGLGGTGGFNEVLSKVADAPKIINTVENPNTKLNEKLKTFFLISSPWSNCNLSKLVPAIKHK